MVLLPTDISNDAFKLTTTFSFCGVTTPVLEIISSSLETQVIVIPSINVGKKISLFVSVGIFI